MGGIPLQIEIRLDQAQVVPQLHVRQPGGAVDDIRVAALRQIRAGNHTLLERTSWLDAAEDNRTMMR